MAEAWSGTHGPGRTSGPRGRAQRGAGRRGAGRPPPAGAGGELGGALLEGRARAGARGGEPGGGDAVRLPRAEAGGAAALPFEEAARLPLLRRLVPRPGRSGRWRSGWPAGHRWCWTPPPCSPRARHSGGAARPTRSSWRASTPGRAYTARDLALAWAALAPDARAGLERADDAGFGAGRRARRARRSGPTARRGRLGGERHRRARWSRAAPGAGWIGRGWRRWAAATALRPGWATRSRGRADLARMGLRAQEARPSPSDGIPLAPAAAALGLPGGRPRRLSSSSSEMRKRQSTGTPRPRSPPARPTPRSSSASTPSTSPPSASTASHACSALPPLVITSSITTTRSPRAKHPSIRFPVPCVLRLLAHREGVHRLARQPAGVGDGVRHGVRAHREPPHRAGRSPESRSSSQPS